jgi:thiol-disulfide isomerase/thioredoxin
MIDNHQLRHYVETMTRVLKSLPQLLVLAALLSLGLGSSGAGAGSMPEANAANPGQTLDVKSLSVKGKTTVIDFYSPFCPPCVQLAPIMAQLAAKRPDLAIQKVNINRPGVQGIDWRSPLAQQYQIRQVPYFMIFNPQGELTAQGREAAESVERWLQGAGLIK